MSDDNFNTDNLGGTQKTRLVKVKRLKKKSGAIPRPENPSVSGNEAYSTNGKNAIAVQQSPNIQNFIPDDPLSAAFSEDDQDAYSQDGYDDYGQGGAKLLTQQPLKMVILSAIVCFIAGFGIARFTGGSGSETTVREGLQGVVINPEVPKGRARCGLVDRTQGCVLYIMNPQRQDLNARDFYDLASQLTGRQRFVIDTANMRYSNTKIKPGAIVQLNIPPLQ